MLKLNCIKDFIMTDGEIVFKEGNSYEFEVLKERKLYKYGGYHWLSIDDMEDYFDLKLVKQYTYEDMKRAFNVSRIIDDVDCDGNVTFVFNNFENWINKK